jgi:hypothetical protein
MIQPADDGRPWDCADAWRGATRREAFESTLARPLAILLSLLVATLVRADDTAPPPEGGAQVMRSRLVNNMVEMIDTRDGAIVVSPQSMPLHVPTPSSAGVAPSIELREQPTGFDLIYTFANTSGTTRALGKLQLGVVNLGQNIRFRDFTKSGAERSADFSYVAPAPLYPAWVYSPVVVMGNAKYTVGVSIQYPLLEYKHQVRPMMYSPGGSTMNGPAGRGWAVEYRLNNFGDETGLGRLDRAASIRPGETRTYVVSVRVADRDDAWQRTLLPYRGFFRATYGGVRYQRDPRPVNCVVLASSDHVSEDNPLGFGQMRANRPDVGGWRVVVEEIRRPRNWPRVMVWMCSGTYQYSRDDEWHFTSRWLASPPLAEALDPSVGFPTVPAMGRELGLWWTESQRYNTGRDALTLFSRQKPSHVKSAFKELDVAVKAGATMIGLDTFHDYATPAWEHYLWLRDMQARFPKVTFITEPIACDVVHTLSPTFLQHWAYTQPPQRAEDVYPITTPHFLADFLLPGHETWGGMRYVDYRQFYGQHPTTEKILQDMAAVAAMGYVPAFPEAIDLNSSARFNAADSWKVTLPEDLWIPDDEMVAAAEASLLGGPSGAERASGGRAVQGSRATRQTGAAGKASGTSEISAGAKPTTGPSVRPGVTRSGVRATPAGTVRIDRSAASGSARAGLDPAQRAAQAAQERRAAAEALRRVRDSFTPKGKPPENNQPPTESDGVRTVTRDRTPAPGEKPAEPKVQDGDKSRKPPPPDDQPGSEKKPATVSTPAPPPAKPDESTQDDDINPDR